MTALPPLHIFYSLLVAIFWGGNFVAAKTAMIDYPPMLMASLRFFIVAAILLPFITLPRGHWKMISILSLTLGTLHFAPVFIGMNMGLDVTTSVLTTQMGVPFSCVLGTIVLKDRLGAWRSVGLLVAFIGIVILAGTPRVSENWTAFLLVLLGTFFWSISNIQLKFIKGVPSLTVLGWIFAFSAPQMLLLSCILEGNPLPTIQQAGWIANAGIAYSAVFSTIIAYGLWGFLLATHPVSSVVPFSLLVPFFGITAGVVFLQETLNLHILAGGLVTMAGVAIIIFRRPRINEAGNTS